jgi:hypothetical protein
MRGDDHVLCRLPRLRARPDDARKLIGLALGSCPLVGQLEARGNSLPRDERSGLATRVEPSRSAIPHRDLVKPATVFDVDRRVCVHQSAIEAEQISEQALVAIGRQVERLLDPFGLEASVSGHLVLDEAGDLLELLAAEPRVRLAAADQTLVQLIVELDKEIGRVVRVLGHAWSLVVVASTGDRCKSHFQIE